MNPSTAYYRTARRDDAGAVAQLMEIAGEGIPSFLWLQSAEPGQTPLEIGAARAAREDGNFSYRNAVLAQLGDTVAGMLLAYRLPQPNADDIAALPTMPALLRPIIELEHEVPGSFYVNALAVFPQYQGQGLGGKLLSIAQERAQAVGCDTLSLQVFAENERAFRFYQRHGYELADRRPIVAHPCYPYSTEVLLVTRRLVEEKAPGLTVQA